jgi:hypothetical protein
MVAQLVSIKFHDGLHGGLPGWGMGMAMIEAKLAQSLAWHDQCLLYQIYIELKRLTIHLIGSKCLRFWQPMELDQGCCASRNTPGTQQNWCVLLGVIMGSRLMPRGALLRGPTLLSHV